MTAGSASRILGLALLASVGCSSFRSTVAAPNHEYMAYRRVRVSQKLEQRLQNSSEYLRKYPEGRWVSEVRPWFDRAEARFYSHHEETAFELAEYLEVLPFGPHAEEAHKKLAIIRTRERVAVKERLEIQAKFTEERLAALAKQRAEAKQSFISWIASFLTISSWGERTTNLDHEFLFAWRIDPPKARCEDNRCAKLVQLPYFFPGGGEDAERVLILDVVLELDSRGVREARLEGPGMFSRFYEVSTGKRVSSDDLTSRIDAIAYAVQVVQGASEAQMPTVECQKEAIAPVVLERSCHGWILRMTAAESPEADDVVAIQGPGRP